MSFTARYYGSAGAAAVESEERFEPTVAEFKEAAIVDHGTQLAKILEVASILVDGVAMTDEGEIPANATVDVLPPFAGG